MAPKRKLDLKSLFYITHVANLPSLVREGLLSHAEVERRGIQYTKIYDAEIVGKRQAKQTPAGLSLWDYANVYFNPRNPMLYRVAHAASVQDIAIVAFKPQLTEIPGVFITDGNAASGPTEFYSREDGLRALADNWEVIQSEWWRPDDGSKRKIMAECLVPKQVPPEMIHAVYVSDHAAADKVRAMVPSRVHVIPEPNMFFRPLMQRRVSAQLSLADGDMFFSRMQTLTISVNVKGVMGKGLASRAKYQFPDVYVEYQDACRSRKLKMGRPYLYKREMALDLELADESTSLPQPNATKWFLLFATKNDWRQDSDLPGIEEGLRWVVDNWKKERIQSLAMPALGCGLGNLAWKDVGPIMCRYLVKLDIPACIYLPRERDMPEEVLSPDFLLAGS